MNSITMRTRSGRSQMNRVCPIVFVRCREWVRPSNIVEAKDITSNVIEDVNAV